LLEVHADCTCLSRDACQIDVVLAASPVVVARSIILRLRIERHSDDPADGKLFANGCIGRPIAG
jgi:hypothetical protein